MQKRPNCGQQVFEKGTDPDDPENINFTENFGENNEIFEKKLIIKVKLRHRNPDNLLIFGQ